MPDPVIDFATVPVVILCGGNGIFIDNTGVRRNKALVEVEGEPMIAHVIRIYLRAGFRTFVLAGGYQASALVSTIGAQYNGTSEPGNPGVLHVNIAGVRCTVRFVDTGEVAQTGDRLKSCRPYIDGHNWFCATYSDTLSDVDLIDMHRFHQAHGKVATLLAAQYPTRFRVLGLRLGETQVRGFSPRPVLGGEPINGGFYFFDRRIFEDRFLGYAAENAILEEGALEGLVSARELMAFFHQGAWQCLDSERDLKPLGRIACSLRW